jgi:hypothetical protein
VFVSTSSNPFRSTADVAADGTVGRSAYVDVDVDGLFAPPIASVERSQPRAASEAPPVAAAVDKQAAPNHKKRLRSADRVGRLLQ